MLAAGPFGLGFPELIIILVVVLLIFGTARVADIGGALGKSIREFRKAAKDDDGGATETSTPEAPRAPRCANCGQGLTPEAKFCDNCGAPTRAAVS
jgi:sec-independent protein translocase protein TatA